MKKSRYSDSQIMVIPKQAEAGTPVPELCREHSMSSATFYKWRAKYGDMDASLTKQMKDLKAENRRLKKIYAEEQLKAEIIQESIGKIFRRRKMAKHGVSARSISIRLACRAFRVSRACYYRQPKLSDE